MSDRWVFLVSFLTVIVILAGAFAMPHYFSYELLKSFMYLAIALLVFFGEDRFSYMLGIVTPPLRFILAILLGGFFNEFAVLFGTLTGKPTPPLDTPLHGLSILMEILLVIVCYRAWHKQVTEKFFGRTFWVSLALAVGYDVLLGAWYLTHPI